jgi:hypothetical protein
MTDLKSLVQLILQESHYDSWLTSLDGTTVIAFEDEAVMGFAYVFDDVESMLADWREIETKLLTMYARPLQKAGPKSWNVYSLFVSSDHANADHLRQVRWIEEDLERTRKIAACGVTTREDVVAALLPLLPLQYQPLLDSEELDLTRRLKKRIAAISPIAADKALDDAVSPAEIVRILEAGT